MSDRPQLELAPPGELFAEAPAAGPPAAGSPAAGSPAAGSPAAGSRTDDRPLPAPARPRFQPLRAGILNVWQYEDQELRFHDGRLILRGENGSGKSKALEVLLPFLLDADLSPYRLDPFQGQARSMRWNLLEGGRHDSRVGYVWLELGRRPEDGGEDGGEPVYLTLGCGLRASRRAAGVDAWYFLTTERVGNELALVNPSRQPLLRKQLRTALGEAGTVFQNAGEYRAEVDRRLFDLGADRFAALRHLLLQLRRPQLSEKLDPTRLSELLGKSLPPIEEDLVAELAELFERLARHEKELARLRSSARSIEAFLGVYREYCRGVATGRSAEMRRGDSRYHAKAEELRGTEEEARAIGERLTDLEHRQREAAGGLDQVRGEIRALEQSEAMKAAQALAVREEHTRTLERQAERDERDGARLGDELERRERELGDAGAESARRTEQLDEPERRAAAGAARAALDAVHDGARGRLAEDAVAHDEAARGSVRAAVTERREAASELRSLAAEHEQAAERFRHAEERRREADEQVRAAHERESEADVRVDEELERLAAALDDWAEGCRELELDEAELERLRAAILPPEEGETRPDLPAVLAEILTQRRDRLIRERTALAARTATLEEERDATAAERERVAAARELGPEPASTRPAPRDGRPGAPFYLLCDFAPSLPDEERAGLEAALEAAGLLDAWVTPDGRPLDPETLDAVFVPSPEGTASAPRTLADVLVPSGESARVQTAGGETAGVQTDVVARLLASVALGTDDGSGGEATAAVDVDGSFRLGPLAGRWTKPAAEHLGAGAREAARRRRLAELDGRLAEQARRLAELEADDRGLAGRLERLTAEARDAPSAAELERRRHAAAAATADLVRRRGELTEAETTVASARRERDATRARLEARAGELRLTPWIRDLGAYGELLRDYQLLFEDLARAHLAACRAARSADRARTRAAEARALHTEAARRAERSRGAARTARAETAALEATVGVEATQVIERHGQAVARRDELETSLETLRDDVTAARERRAVIEERRLHRAAELERLDAERQLATQRIRRLVELGFVALVLDERDSERDGETDGDAAPDERPWSLSRALEIARALARETSSVDAAPEAADRRTNRLMARYRELDGEIGGDFQSRLEREDELLIFRVSHQQRDLDGSQFLAVLLREVAEREAELAEDERELMRRILLGDVGDHLRTRLRQAHDLVREMNRLLVACPTASGMTLRLAWRPDEDADSGVRLVLDLLLRDPELLNDNDRRKIEAFFQARVDATRDEHALVPWREHLLEALDYRLWHRFHVERRQPGESAWNKLTQRGHAASSGGEKAVALHLPLFAAAAAHYRSARDEAPRLILLDEAFAGIDTGMRGRCMALLVRFDLDFMMTSYDEWGCYEELPGVATYQLYRDATLGGVEAIRFVWNGRSLREDGLSEDRPSEDRLTEDRLTEDRPSEDRPTEVDPVDDEAP